LYIVVTSLIVLFLFLDLRVHALVLSFIIALILYMRFACYSITWFPSIIFVGFLLAKVCPFTCNIKRTQFVAKGSFYYIYLKFLQGKARSFAQ
jgi:uncharacterized membrane protein